MELQNGNVFNRNLEYKFDNYKNLQHFNCNKFRKNKTVLNPCLAHQHEQHNADLQAEAPFGERRLYTKLVLPMKQMKGDIN